MTGTRIRTTEAAWIGAAGAGIVLLFLAVGVQKIWAGDFWGQLRTGQWILETLRLPVADDFSFTAAGREVREVRWLYCVLIALGWKVGPWLLCIGQAVVLGVMWGVIVWPVRRVLVSPWAWVILGLGIAGGAGRWVLRPELATDLFIAVFLVVLERTRRSERIGAAWWLVGVQVLWVNLHSVYVFGPVLAWMFAGSVVAERVMARFTHREECEPKRPLWHGCVLALVVTAACWVNPYFHRGAMYAMEMWREAGGFVGEMLGEMRSPLTIPISIWRWDLWCAAALVVLVVGTYVLNWRRVNPARLGVLVMALYLGATAQRNLPLLVIMGVWAGLSNLAEWRESRGDKFVVPKWRRVGARVGHVAAGLGGALLAWYVATDRAWTDISVPRETGLGVVEWDVPRGAAEFVVSSGARPQVYNHMREGHYLGWVTGGRIKVFVDGRTDVFGDEFLREYTSTGAATWDAISAKWGINTAIMPVRGYEELIAFLVKHKDWVLVYLDHRNVVFVRNIAEHAELIRGRVDPAAQWVSPVVEPVEKAEWWKRLIGGRGRPWYTFGMAQSFLAVESYENAKRYLERTLERFPKHERAIAELASVYRLEGRRADGDRLFAMLRPGSEWAEYSERMLKVRVSDRVLMGDRYFGEKRYGEARGEYEAAVKAGVDTAAEWKKLGYVREQLGQLAEAEEAYRRSVARDGNQHEVWYLMGLVQGRRGEKAAARESLERAVRIKPDYGVARRALEGLGR